MAITFLCGCVYTTKSNWWLLLSIKSGVGTFHAICTLVSHHLSRWWPYPSLRCNSQITCHISSIAIFLFLCFVFCLFGCSVEFLFWLYFICLLLFVLFPFINLTQLDVSENREPQLIKNENKTKQNKQTTSPLPQAPQTNKTSQFHHVSITTPGQVELDHEGKQIDQACRRKAVSIIPVWYLLSDDSCRESLLPWLHSMV